MFFNHSFWIIMFLFCNLDRHSLEQPAPQIDIGKDYECHDLRDNNSCDACRAWKTFYLEIRHQPARKNVHSKIKTHF